MNSEEKDRKILELTQTMLKDDDECERLIAENSDAVYTTLKAGLDVRATLMELLIHWAECDAERFYE